MVIVEHVRSNAYPWFTINNTKRSFDPRPLAQRCVTEESSISNVYIPK